MRLISKELCKKAILLAWIFLGVGALQAEPMPSNKIEVFSERALPVQAGFVPPLPMEIVYYELDSPYELKRGLDESGEEVFTVEVETDEEGKPISPTREEIDKKSKAVQAAKQLLEQYDLRWLPAIVFEEGKAVVYGITDVGDALKRYQAWKQQVPR